MLHCEVAIVGGGIGGLYTAESLLRHEKETNVCLFDSRETSVLVDDSTITCFLRCRMKLWVGVYGLYLGLYLEKQ